jgi:hypothetical protein
MESYQERVVEEKRELDEKLAKLVVFGHTEQFLLLSSDEKDRMSHQHSSMEAYSKVLGERIEAFSST